MSRRRKKIVKPSRDKGGTQSKTQQGAGASSITSTSITDSSSAVVSPSPGPESGTAEGSQLNKRVALTAITAIVLLGVLLRIAGARGDFWLDEIWSYRFAFDVDSWTEIFTKVKHDNNHFLNTLLIRIMGPEASIFAYRVPAILAGTASIIFAALIGWRTSRVTAVIAAMLVSCSYLMVHYASEARGYATLMFFCLLCHYVMLRAIDAMSRATDAISRASDATLRTSDSKGFAWSVGYAFAAMLGLLSHLTFVCCLAGHFVWLVIVIWQRTITFKQGSLMALIQFLPPAVLMIWLWNVNLSGMVKGGGDLSNGSLVIAQTLSLTVGVSPYGWTLALGMLLGILLLILAVWHGFQTSIAHCIGVLAMLMTLVITMQTASEGIIYVRYFLVALPIVYLLVAAWLGNLWTSSQSSRWAASILILLFLAGNLWLTSGLIQQGRGGFSKALATMREETDSEQIVVYYNEPEFRTQLVLGFYDQRLPSQRQLAESMQPEWVIIHSQEQGFTPVQEQAFGNQEYSLREFFPYSDLSGFHWALYRRKKPTE